MKKSITFLLCVMSIRSYAMDPTTPRLRRDTNHAIAPEEQRRMEASLPSLLSQIATQITSPIMVAAWAVTPKTTLDIHDKIIISKYPNGRYGIKHFSRPKGLKETRCELSCVLEIPNMVPSESYKFLLQRIDDELQLTVPEQKWYRHPLATHAGAVLGTVLSMRVLFWLVS